MYNIRIMNKIINENESVGNTSNSDNKNDNGKREKRVRKRLSKSERYVEERNELIRELNEIIGLDKENRIILYELERNEILENKLIEKIPEIRRIFKSGGWGFMISERNEEGSGKIITLLRSIYENSGYKIYSKQEVINKNEKKERGTIYYFSK